MIRLLKNITDSHANAAMLERGVDVLRTAGHRSMSESEPLMGPLKRLLQDFTDTMADAALLEMGVSVITPVGKTGEVHESLEDIFVEVAFAEAGDYNDIHEAIQREHRADRDIAHPDECQYGDSHLCLV
jgi:hypothetical protein